MRGYCFRMLLHQQIKYMLFYILVSAFKKWNLYETTTYRSQIWLKRIFPSPFSRSYKDLFSEHRCYGILTYIWIGQLVVFLKKEKIATKLIHFTDYNIKWRSCYALLQGIFQPRDQTQVSHIADGFFTIWATREAHKWL